MKAKIPVLLLLCVALLPALSACGNGNQIGVPTPTANAAEVASVTPVTQPNAGMGATAQSNMLTAAVNPTPVGSPTSAATASVTVTATTTATTTP